MEIYPLNRSHDSFWYRGTELEKPVWPFEDFSATAKFLFDEHLGAGRTTVHAEWLDERTEKKDLSLNLDKN